MSHDYNLSLLSCIHVDNLSLPLCLQFLQLVPIIDAVPATHRCNDQHMKFKIQGVS